MKEYNITNWQNYWYLFDKLIELLEADAKKNIVLELKTAQQHVNGLTDGWYEFMIAFEKSIETHEKSLTDEQMDIALFLILSLKKQLG